MLNGKYRGKDIGSGTDVWKFSEAVRGGKMSLDAFMRAESGMSRSRGTCMTMGTASTMACLVEALGMSLPENGTLPAVDARRQTLAHLTGGRIVEMVKEDLKPSDILTKSAFENAIRANAAIGGSTNAVVHLLAIAGRVGVDLTLDDWDRIGAKIPCLVDLMPSGRFLMEDFHYAGGFPALIQRLSHLFDMTTNTVCGASLGEITEGAECFNEEVIRPLDNPLRANAGIAVLRGNLSPQGAIIKPSAATPELLQHTGKAVVFENIEDYKARIDTPELDVDKDSILVLKGCGPKGYPGMPEVGNMALPSKLLEQGVTDMVRISDARMSGTAFGTVVLHVAPESTMGGPLALVQHGDEITLDVEGRGLHLHISDEEMARRKAAWKPEKSDYHRGYAKLYIDHVMQADQGADLDFLVGSSGSKVSRESH
jgi:dihydroxy-acid dehydratase